MDFDKLWRQLSGKCKNSPEVFNKNSWDMHFKNHKSYTCTFISTSFIGLLSVPAFVSKYQISFRKLKNSLNKAVASHAKYFEGKSTSTQHPSRNIQPDLLQVETTLITTAFSTVPTSRCSPRDMVWWFPRDSAWENFQSRRRRQDRFHHRRILWWISCSHPLRKRSPWSRGQIPKEGRFFGRSTVLGVLHKPLEKKINVIESNKLSHSFQTEWDFFINWHRFLKKWKTAVQFNERSH